LLGNEREISKYTTALVSKFSVNNGRYYAMAAADTHATTGKLLEAMFSVRPLPRLYNDGQLPLETSLETAVRRAEGWCERPPACEGGNVHW
jgi:hypothetical protein